MDAFGGGIITTQQASDIFSLLKDSNFSAESLIFVNRSLAHIAAGAIVDFDERIIEEASFENSKANCLFEKLKQRSEGYRDLLFNFLEESSADLKFRVEPIPQTNPAGVIHGEASPPEDGIITITINKDSLEDIPALNLVGVILYESLHAEIFNKLLEVFNNGGSISGITNQKLQQVLNENKFPDMFDAIRKYGIQHFQHDLMAERYLGAIVEGLKSYDRGQHTDQFYRDLACIGLMIQNPIESFQTQRREE